MEVGAEGGRAVGMGRPTVVLAMVPPPTTLHVSPVVRAGAALGGVGACAAAQLAQPESRFGRFAVGDDELSLHWLEVPSSTAESATRPLVHCNHGFGASALSWRPCMRGLADRC